MELSSTQRILDVLIDVVVGLNAVCALLALVVPIAMLKGGRSRAARTGLNLTVATTILAFGVLVLLKLAAIVDTGNCLLLTIPLTALTWLSGLVWLVVFARSPA